MLTHPTLNQLRALKLDGMADAFVELASQPQIADLAHAEWLALLLDREAANRCRLAPSFPRCSNVLLPVYPESSVFSPCYLAFGKNH